MVIDDIMPLYDVSKRYSMTIAASADKVYSALKKANLNDSPFIRLLFLLRGLPAIYKSPRVSAESNRLTISDIANSGFMLLAEKPEEEIVIGIVGQFWKPTGNIHPIRPEEFASFSEKHFAKATWNFLLHPISPSATELSTETRVYGTDDTSKKQFRRYWRVIGPFSGIIRKELLNIIKRDAENSYA